MQLPTLRTEPVRVSIDITWYPGSDTCDISRRVWSMSSGASHWQLEDMVTNGTPLQPSEARRRFRIAAGHVTDLLDELRASENFPPFD